MDDFTKHNLRFLDKELQIFVDYLISVRQNAKNGDKQLYSYISKKVDQAAKDIGMALEKIENSN